MSYLFMDTVNFKDTKIWQPLRVFLLLVIGKYLLKLYNQHNTVPGHAALYALNK